MPDTNTGRPRLIRCDVLNAFNAASVRFVELEAFKLWEYLMQHKHGMKVTSAALCLWIDEQDFARNESLYARAGDIEEVDQVSIRIFDPRYHYTFNINRYALRHDTEQVREILLSHVPAEIIKSDACEVQVTPGCCIETVKTRDWNDFVLGLAGAY